MGLKRIYIVHLTLEILDIVANQAALANALPDKEPAGDLCDDNGIDSDLLHRGLEYKSIFVNLLHFHKSIHIT